MPIGCSPELRTIPASFTENNNFPTNGTTSRPRPHGLINMAGHLPPAAVVLRHGTRSLGLVVVLGIGSRQEVGHVPKAFSVHTQEGPRRTAHFSRPNRDVRLDS